MHINAENKPKAITIYIFHLLLSFIFIHVSITHDLLLPGTFNISIVHLEEF